jgi:hypothetical protein
MKTVLKKIVTVVLVSILLACSMAPESPVTRKQLVGSGVYQAFTIDESPEEILNALNMEGEVVVKAMEGRYPVFVKIMATADGLKISSYGR